MGSKIESIRPGGTFDSSFREYPLPELIFGILRANLSGRVDFALRSQPRNRAYFRDGVPIGVDLPDTGVSMISLLQERGFLPVERAEALTRLAEQERRSPASVLLEQRILGPAELDALEGQLARAQLQRLFDQQELPFRFTEGVALEPDCALAILEPLPLVFLGLKIGRDRTVLQRFLETHQRSTFTLGATYPLGVDPFGWGPALEAEVARPEQVLSLEGLVEAGIDGDSAAAALAGLLLAGMVELREAGAARRPSRPPPEAPKAGPEAREVKAPRAPPKESKEPGGLQIHRRAEPAPEVAKTKTGPTPAVSVPVSAHDAEYAEVRDRLQPHRSQNYFQLLRAAVGSDLAQLERAHRFLVRRLEEEGDDWGRRALRALLEDAFTTLRDPEQGRRYTKLVEGGEGSPVLLRERLALEAESNVDRAILGIPEHRTGTAAYLLAWAEKQDPNRRDVDAYYGFLDYWRASRAERVGQVGALGHRLDRALEQRPDDARLRLCYAYLYADSGDAQSAARLLEEAEWSEHPLAQVVLARLRHR